jgi:hypothetical protein
MASEENLSSVVYRTFTVSCTELAITYLSIRLIRVELSESSTGIEVE